MTSAATLGELLRTGVSARIPTETLASQETLETALACLEHAAESGTTTGLRAVAAGLASDRVAWAVLGGYQAALRKLLHPLTFRRASFCVSEERGGGHPRFIDTRLERREEDGTLIVTGQKSFATLATHADRFIVIARENENANANANANESVAETGRNRLRAVVVAPHAAGVTVEERSPLPFAPEIPHARLTLSGAPVEALLEGDGYLRYVKPFRTVEDEHVMLAVAGYAFREAAHYGWNSAPITSALASLLELADHADADLPATHLALDRALQEVTAALDGLPWSDARSEVSARWKRDRPILEVASGARQKRAEKARS